MPKLKTKSGAKKRFKMSKSGKIKKSNAFKSHLLTSKTTKRIRKLRKSTLVSTSEEKRVKRMMPYSG